MKPIKEQADEMKSRLDQMNKMLDEALKCVYCGHPMASGSDVNAEYMFCTNLNCGARTPYIWTQRCVGDIDRVHGLAAEQEALSGALMSCWHIANTYDGDYVGACDKIMELVQGLKDGD